MNGKPGDHPINDICDHQLSVFSPKADALIREIHKYLPRYRMWDLFDWFNPPKLGSSGSGISSPTLGFVILSSFVIPAGA